MKLRRFNWFNLLRFAGIVLFIVVLARTNLQDLWGWLKQVDVRLLLLAFLFQVLLLLFKCIRWLILNENGFMAGRLKQRFGEFLEAYAIGVVTPGRAGELLKAGHAKGKTQVISSGLLVLSERGLDLSIFFFIAGLAPALGKIIHLDPGVGGVFLAVAALGILISFSILIFPVVSKALEKLLKLIRIISKDQGLDFIPRKPSTLINFLVLTLLSNLCAFLSFFFIARSVGISLDFITISGSVAMTGVINTIPVTIMGVGTRDVTLLYLLSEIPKAQVLAFSGLILLVSQIGGGILAMISGHYFLLKAKKNNPS